MKALRQLLKYRLNGALRVDRDQLVLALVQVDHPHRLQLERLEPLPYHLNVIIRSTTSLTPLQQPLLQCLLTAFEVYHEGNLNLVTDNVLPHVVVLLVSGKAVD